MMTCSECERLFDSYLDGHLSGTLRLEFDAHRLRCRHCQQSLAMLESCQHVIAFDSDVRSISDDFTHRVMGDIAARREARILPFRLRSTRAAIVAGGLMQAAAVVLIAIFLTNNQTGTTRAPDSRTNPMIAVANTGSDLPSDPEVVEEMVFQSIRKRLLAATTELDRQTRGLAAYVNVDLPDDVVQASSNAASLNPLTWPFEALLPPPAGPEHSEPDNQGSDHFAL
jgi:hypothetical protein